MNFEITYYSMHESEIPVFHLTYKYIDIIVRCYQDIENFIMELEGECDEDENFHVSYNDFYIHRVDDKYVISNYSELYYEYSLERQSYWEYKIKPKVITKLIDVLKNGPTIGNY